MKTVPRDLFNMGDQSNKSNCIEQHGPNNYGELNWVREDMLVQVIEKPPFVMDKIDFDEEDFDDTLFDFDDTPFVQIIVTCFKTYFVFV